MKLHNTLWNYTTHYETTQHIMKLHNTLWNYATHYENTQRIMKPRFQGTEGSRHADFHLKMQMFQLPFPSRMGSRIEISGHPSEHPAQNCATAFLYFHKIRETADKSPNLLRNLPNGVFYKYIVSIKYTQKTATPQIGLLKRIPDGHRHNSPKVPISNWKILKFLYTMALATSLEGS